MNSRENYLEMQEIVRQGGAVCPVRYALAIIGQKWKIPILWHLAEEKRPLRYSDLKRSIPGVTDVMLSKCLDELAENGLIHRNQYDCIPPRVEYTLTERGDSLIPVLYTIHAWGQEQLEIDVEKRGDLPC